MYISYFIHIVNIYIYIYIYCIYCYEWISNILLYTCMKSMLYSYVILLQLASFAGFAGSAWRRRLVPERLVHLLHIYSNGLTSCCKDWHISRGTITCRAYPGTVDEATHTVSWATHPLASFPIRNSNKLPRLLHKKSDKENMLFIRNPTSTGKGFQMMAMS